MKTLDAIKKLNAVKKEDGELLLAEPIDLKELKGAKEHALAEAFMNAIEGIPVEDEEQVPDELADVYNSLADAEKGIAAEAEKTVEKKAEKASEKKATKEPVKSDKEVPVKKEEKKTEKKVDKKPEKPAAKVAEKKTEVKKASNKDPKKEKGVGVIASILSIIKEFQPITKENIIKKLVKQFPDRDEAAMSKTVQVQIGGKGVTRIEKEKGVKLKKSDNGEISLGKK